MSRQEIRIVRYVGSLNFNGPDDPEHPQNWRMSHRIWATFMLAMFNLVVTIASSIFGSAQVKVAEEFAVSQEVTILGTSLFLVFEPEFRLPVMTFGGCLVPVGLFWYAWTADPKIPWPSEACAGFLIDWGMYTVFIQCFAYIVDCYPDRANSAMAANGAVRSIFGASFPLFARYMFHSFGVDWASSLLGFISLAMVPVPVIFWRYGANIRARSKAYD